MSSSYNLLTSDGGQALVPEICLRIAELLLDSEPRAIGNMFLLSKSFNTLLATYEKSVTKSVCEDATEFRHTNDSQEKVLSSGMPPGDILVKIQTYPWFAEMRYRKNTIEFLVEHELTEMTDVTQRWPNLDVPKREFLARQTRFKKSALFLLYRLADCAASLCPSRDIRARQSEFLDSLTLTELASLGIMVEVMGQNYYYITKKAIVDSGLPVALNLRQSQHSESYTPQPPTAPIADLLNDNWVRECMCVFEDLVQRFGPYFAWAYLEGSAERVRRSDLWARSKVQEGLDNMNAFELGYTMSYASLQSVVWKVFCKKQSCSLADSWNEAKVLVEIEMAAYTIGA